MKRAKIFAGLSIAALAPAIIFLSAVPASAQRPSGHVQTIRGHLIESSDFGYATGYVSIDRDFAADGRQIASDVTTCRAANAAATTARCDAAIGLPGGLITITFAESSNPAPVHGLVTGGTGTYLHAAGTVVIVEGANNDDQPSTADWVITLVDQLHPNTR